MAKIVGRVKEIWRYPVKSMGGELRQSGLLEKYGLVGDRGWAVRDEQVGEIRGVRKIPALLKLAAAYTAEPEGKTIPGVDVTFPDGVTINTDDGELENKLSDFLERRISLWPLQPKSNFKHYRLGGLITSKDIMNQFGVAKPPDVSHLPMSKLLELSFFATPLGRYYDVFPLHILTTASLEEMKSKKPEGDFRVERFRPNLLIETEKEQSGLAEFQWCGGKLRIGETIIACDAPTIRCSAPAMPQPGLEKDPEVVKALVEHSERHLGVYARVLKRGPIKVGDTVELDRPDYGPMRDKIINAQRSFKRGMARVSMGFGDLFD